MLLKFETLPDVLSQEIIGLLDAAFLSFEMSMQHEFRGHLT